MSDQQNIKDSHSVVIRITNLTKKFGELVAVDNLSFNIFQGEVFGFLGPNGAGKTTSINMICGLTPPTDGQISIFGDALQSRNDLKSKIGVCPQENIFWPKLTCLEQLAFMGQMYGLSRQSTCIRSRELLDWMALSDKSNVQAARLSGGMKRRLNICHALIHDPPILILDEPEAGLDPQGRVLVRDFIKSLTPKKTIILTTHNMDEADRLAERVAIIDRGKLLLLDTPENLKKSIGAGDILEINLDAKPTSAVEPLLSNLQKICENVKVTGSTIIIKSMNLIEKVSDITATIKDRGVNIKQITLRENTLEDVFITLTGRKLRQ